MRLRPKPGTGKIITEAALNEPLHFFLVKFLGICYNYIVMEKRKNFYVSNKNALTWLMALCLVGSAVARIVIACMKGTGDSLQVWSQIVLPVVATLLFVYIILFNGKEMFYKTAIPVWMIVVYSGIWISSNVSDPIISWLFWIALIFFGVIYMEITCGRWGNALWLLLPVMLPPIVAILYLHSEAVVTLDWNVLLPLIPDLLMLFAGCLLVFVIRIHNDGKYHPTWGDRIDGRKIRTLAPMAQITAYF